MSIKCVGIVATIVTGGVRIGMVCTVCTVRWAARIGVILQCPKCATTRIGESKSGQKETTTDRTGHTQ